MKYKMHNWIFNGETTTYYNINKNNNYETIKNESTLACTNETSIEICTPIVLVVTCTLCTTTNHYICLSISFFLYYFSLLTKVKLLHVCVSVCVFIYIKSMPLTDFVIHFYFVLYYVLHLSCMLLFHLIVYFNQSFM